MKPITGEKEAFYFSTVTTRLSQFKKLYYSQYISTNFFIERELLFVRVKQISNKAFNRKRKLLTIHENKITETDNQISIEN